jgi:hypothetical protein
MARSTGGEGGGDEKGREGKGEMRSYMRSLRFQTRPHTDRPGNRGVWNPQFLLELDLEWL